VKLPKGRPHDISKKVGLEAPALHASAPAYYKVAGDQKFVQQRIRLCCV